MDKKGDIDSVLSREIIYYILLALFFGVLLYFVLAYHHGAAALEEVYAKELERIIDSSEAGTDVSLDVTPATKAAYYSGKKSVNDIFKFDNANKEIIVSLRNSHATRFYFLKNVTVVNWHIETVSEDLDTNRLVFSIQ